MAYMGELSLWTWSWGNGWRVWLGKQDFESLARSGRGADALWTISNEQARVCIRDVTSTARLSIFNGLLRSIRSISMTRKRGRLDKDRGTKGGPINI